MWSSTEEEKGRLGTAPRSPSTDACSHKSGGNHPVYGQGPYPVTYLTINTTSRDHIDNHLSACIVKSSFNVQKDIHGYFLRCQRLLNRAYQLMPG
ncbi:hypothetical protein J6590_073786 [Homalodisca vitripennis]|nr:hypothetical protein J6590_090474 [Homalodisca vitripennis]KAG8290865.1 hypothetical protein J6590_073786 [Homalodisca vitripennis]